MVASIAGSTTAAPEIEKSTISPGPPISNGMATGGDESTSKTLNSNVPTVEDLTTRTLRFLSTASTETLGAITVGLVACTYFILGRLGLVLIGALGGIILHATWEGQLADDRRKEKGLDVVKRVLDWRESRQVQAIESEDPEGLTSPGRGFDGFRPETATALNDLVEAVVRDYVKWWYSPVLPSEESFPAACRHTLTTFLRSISIHLSRKRPADTFLDFLTNSSSIFIVFLTELSNAINASQGNGLSPSEAVQEYLFDNPDSNLANVLSDKQQRKKFKAIAEDVLQNFLDKPVLACNQTRIFLREILSGVIMQMVLNACSKPEWLNGWIVYLLEDGEPELIQAIDAGMGTSIQDDTDGNKSRRTEEKRHRKRLSKAEEAMEEAMEEAKRLSQLIAEEDNLKKQSSEASRRDTITSRNSQPQQTETAATKVVNTATATKPSPSQPLFNGNLAKTDETVEVVSSLASNPATSPKPAQSSNKSFTSFDQIIPANQPTALLDGIKRPRGGTTTLTLHNAGITIYDDLAPSDNGRIRNKPTSDYLVQIEPESSQHPGWMIVRHYTDFETLHEVLRRIAAISGVAAFTEQHGALPNWKTHTKASLRGELERYLRDACWHQQLAESEGMKRFLEKDQSQMQANASKGLGWPSPSAFENMGKGMLDVLTNAPKGAADGGKAVLGGVTGVLGNLGSLGQKKRESVSSFGTHAPGKLSTSTLPHMDNFNSPPSARLDTENEDNLRMSPIVATQPAKVLPMERRPSHASTSDLGERDLNRSRVSLSSRSGRSSTSNSRAPSRAPSLGPRISSPTSVVDIDNIILPPLPSDIPDDYAFEESGHILSDSMAATGRTSTSSVRSLQSSSRPSLSGPPRPAAISQSSPRKIRKENPPLSEAETRVAVELLFAVVNELYTLSSAWNIRRTLLTAAKTFLLRPGNPSLSSIQSLIQDSLIASNISDEGIAAHLRKLRANSLPTEEELKAWPADMTPSEKEALRIKARKLLLERGLPPALTGVMGQAATTEALGRVFDCLQLEEVAKGLMFGLLLQGVRAMTQ